MNSQVNNMVVMWAVIWAVGMIEKMEWLVQPTHIDLREEEVQRKRVAISLVFLYYMKQLKHQ